MAHDVFISYSSHDKPVADAVCAGLETRGARCWIAPRDILPGKSWSKAIMDGIHGCPIMVVIFSRSSNNSKQVLREIERAVNQNMTIVPYRIDDIEMSDDLEYFLSVPHWLDALTPDTEAHVARLGDTIQALLGTPAVTPPMSAPAKALDPPQARPASSSSKTGLYLGIGGLAVALLVAIALLIARPGESEPETTNPPHQKAATPDAPDAAPPPSVTAVAPDAAEVEEEQGGIEVRTVPPGAEIRIDGALRGTAPIEVALDPGDYYVEASLKDFEVAGEKITVAPGMVERIEFMLVAMEKEAVEAGDEGSLVPASGPETPPTGGPASGPEPPPTGGPASGPETPPTGGPASGPEPPPTVEPAPAPTVKIRPETPPSPPPIELRVSRVRISGALEDDDDASAILRRRWSKLTSCHRRHLTGSLAGRSVDFTVMVNGMGEISDRSAEPDSSAYNAFLDCSEAAFSGVIFPETDGFSTIRFRVGK
jgi:hypothetical protein